MASVRMWVSYLVPNMVVEDVGFVIRWWVECKWYFTVMAAGINGKEAGSLFPCEKSYQLVGLLTGYNSKNWPALVVELTRSVC